MTIKVFLIIVNYNCKNYIIDCLNSINSLNIKDYILKTIVVDNASTDNSVQLIKQGFPQIKIIQNQKNLGFGQANNLAIKYGLKHKADFILLLNPDTKIDLDRKFLFKLIKIANQNKDIGILGPCLKYKTNKKTLYDYGGKLNIKLARAWHINKNRKLKNKTEKYLNRDFVSGACMLIKRKVFEKNIFFDSHYFLYLEDVDFCLQAKRVGFKIVNVASAEIFHYGGKSSNDYKKIFYSWLSSLIFTFKWTPFLWKPISLIYNSLFYPYLLISWSLKRVKRIFLRSL